ncbi:zonadhesin-like isoform X2 [Alligator mississippiensis]|uniref:zonadhesin-like isoform X2 n=1 Tax=Alligator mississippiensis TaxID=8496 RepID=UPI000907490B|nr:zonadhesin-like isoform X2 [Alligator mississippiensis]
MLPAVPSSACPWTGASPTVAVGESWMDDANCTRRCTCRSPENIACEAWSCLPGQECSERGRWLGCHDTRAATCYVFGNLHYVTFDGASVTLTGTCSYTLARVCGTHPGLEDFTVMGTNAPSDAPGSSFLVRVDMTVGGACMALLRGHQVLVDGVRVSPPLRNRLRGLAVTEAGTFVEVRSQGGLVLRYDGHHLLELRVPGAYYSQVCGLCGNFNHQPEDDLTLPAGCPAPSAPALGSAWQAPGPSPPGCQEDNSEDLMPPCSPEDLARWAALCQELQAPVFAVCHPRVPVAPFADACLFDLCATRGQASALCYAAQAYSKACQAQGGPPVAWRNSTFCPLLCPLNSCYTPCAPACPPSCAEPLAPTACPEDQACSEGCDCDVGHLRSGDACVPAGECGCVDDEGHYHSVNGVLTNLPFSPDDDLSIGFWGLQILLQTQGGFSVTFDGLHYAELVLPEPYRGVVGGLCGTLNGDPEDDFTLPDGASTHSLERFGEAWRVHAPPPRQAVAA